jgi:23S rRNA (cytosine1962-C5)-methyltransferase
MKNRASIQVNEYSYSWLQKGFDWIYKKEIKKKKGVMKPGEWISILSPHGTNLGMGIWCGGNISCRRFSTEEEEPAQLIVRKLKEALARRPHFLAEESWRWIHGENDALPGVRIDVWGEEYVITLAHAALESLLPLLLQGIEQVRPAKAVWGYVRGKTVTPLGILSGEAEKEGLWVQELGLSYWVEPGRSPDAGVFGDMRELRDWLSPYWSQKKVLNLFCFTGAFSVSAAHQGAQEVVSVDLSPTYIEWVKKNMEGNGISLEGNRFVVSDANKALERFRRKNDLFDVVIADPPSFSHGDGVWSVERDLSGLVLRCLRVLKPNGMMIIATNHGKMSPKEFSKAIVQASYKEKRPLRILKQYSPSIDHPAALSFPESRYLKCWVLQG